MSRMIRTVACCMSGGVDSTVSAYLLKKKGYRPLIKCYEFGATPNADILCNRFVKFNLLFKKILKQNAQSANLPTSNCFVSADAIATGHYCQNSMGNFLENTSEHEPCLLRSVDSVKDQTFWLSTVSQKQLLHTMFPVGSLLKPTVKQIAAEIGLPSIATRRESMGMCFIGKRRFSDFIDSYISPKPGVFRDLETGQILDEHLGVHHYTLGQRANITRTNGPFYVARMEYQNQNIFVVRDIQHPSLFMQHCWTGPAIWINSLPPQLPSFDRIMFQWQNKWRSVACTIHPHASVTDAALKTHSCVSQSGISTDYGEYLLSTIDPVEHDIEGRSIGPCLSIALAEPMRCVAAGQWAALYQGNQCLGGALICGSLSLWDEGLRKPYTQWKQTNFELRYEVG